MERDIPAVAGTYVLLLRIETAITVEVGRLGVFDLSPAWYAYVGSARGPGGLAARIGRHLRPASEKRLRWHIDYLTAHVPVTEVIWAIGDERRECQWAQSLLALPGACVAIARFGASDCACSTHLIQCRERPVHVPWTVDRGQ